MNIDEVSSEALRLGSQDRATLAEIIWESLEDPFLQLDELSDEEAIELSKLRSNEIDSGQIVPLTHSELMTKLRNES